MFKGLKTSLLSIFTKGKKIICMEQYLTRVDLVALLSRDT